MSSSQRKREAGGPSRAKNCAECRRLKIKCDRQVPCSNCVKRGMSSICPGGQLLPKEQRVIVSTTDDLYSKITELTDRIRELEEALASLQAQHSDEPHPLLSKSEDVPLTSFGSLVIKEDGNALFFGATSSVEWIMAMQEDNRDESTTPERIELAAQSSIENGPMVESMSTLFPLPINGADKSVMINRAILELPDKGTAVALVDAYYIHAAWETSPISRETFIKDYFGPCYEKSSGRDIILQDFALVYAILAMGMLHSTEVPTYIKRSLHYISLARGCLAAGDFITNASIGVIDATLICATYHFSAEEPYKAWVLVGVALKLAVGMGLHREPSIWGLPPHECDRRRRTMWELITCELWGALMSGRPPMISRRQFDVRIPIDSADASESNPNYSIGKYYFCETCLWQVLDLGLASSNKATYAAVMKVDTKIRNWDLPKALQKNGPAEEEGSLQIFKKTMELIFKEITLLCLHRAYFANALLEPPYDPLQSLYSRSVLAAYGSACAIIDNVRRLYKREPVSIVRFSFFWTHAFSSAVTLASIAIRAPDCRLAPTALVEFDSAVEMFDQAKGGYRVGHGLPTLRRLQTKAHASYDSFCAGTWVRPTTTDSQLQHGLGGSATIQHVRARPQDSSAMPASAPAYQPSDVPMTADVMNLLETNEPSLEEYLKSFGFDPTSLQVQDQQSANAHREPMATGASVSSSDSFLHGVLTGQWNEPPIDDRAHLPPQTTPSSQANPTEADLYGNIDQLLYAPIQQYQDPKEGAQPTHGSHGQSPSEGVTSSQGSSGGGAGFGESITPLTRPPSGFSMDTTVEDPQAANFMWDNFLRELGVQDGSS